MDFYKLSKTVLFQGATPEETEQMLSCLKAGKRKYKKEEMIYRAGEVVSCVGVVSVSYTHLTLPTTPYV